MSLRREMAFDIDADAPGGNSYGFAPATGNLMYCMPQEGTRAAFYMGSGDEAQGKWSYVFDPKAFMQDFFTGMSIAYIVPMVSLWATAWQSIEATVYNNVNIIGQINSELDEVDITNQIIYEDKNALGLYMENPSHPQTEAAWAESQILKKGSNRIEALRQPEFSVFIKGSDDVPDVASLRSIRDFVFRINADTPELRQAVEECLERLRELYPEYNFSATYGGA